MICSYITDHRRIPGGFRESVALSIDDLERISVFHSMPEIIEDEITEPVRWFLEFFIPFDLLKIYRHCRQSVRTDLDSQFQEMRG